MICDLILLVCSAIGFIIGMLLLTQGQGLHQNSVKCFYWFIYMYMHFEHLSSKPFEMLHVLCLLVGYSRYADIIRMLLLIEGLAHML